MQRDEFFWLSTINKATVVVNRAEGLIGDDTAKLAARGIRAVEEAGAADPAKRVKTYINCYSNNDHCLRQLVEKLTGRSAFKGKSPVDAFCGKWDAHL